MPRHHVFRLLTAVLCLGCGAALAQEQRPALAQIPFEAQQTLVLLLQQNCEAQEADRFRDSLKALHVQLEPILWEAYRLGPTAEVVRANRVQMTERYQERQAWLETEGARLFGEEEAARFGRVGPEEYVERELESAAINWRTNAVKGLGVVGTGESLPDLERIAEDPESPTAVAAEAAIERIEAGAPR